VSLTNLRASDICEWKVKNNALSIRYRALVSLFQSPLLGSDLLLDYTNDNQLGSLRMMLSRHLVKSTASRDATNYALISISAKSSIKSSNKFN